MISINYILKMENKLLVCGSLQGRGKTQTNNLDLSNEINGLYLLVLKDSINGSVITEKVIKQ